MSRKHLFLLSLLLSGCAAYQPPPTPAAPTPPVLPQPTVETVDVIPIKIENGRPYIDLTVDGKSYHALLDTGASMTMIDAAETTQVVPTGTQVMADFKGVSFDTKTAKMKVCVGVTCEDEIVSMVPGLTDKVIIQGSFFQQFHTVQFDFRGNFVTVIGQK